MECSFCKSEFLCLKEAEGKTGLYCRSCGRWLKWVDPSEKPKILSILEKQRNEVRLDGQNVQRVMEHYRNYKEKYRALTEEIRFLKERSAKSKNEMERKALYEKVLKLKELTAKIAAYDEILLILGLK